MATALLTAAALHGEAKRLVIVKVDGLPADRIERLMEQREPETGRPLLPWMRHIFLERGAIVRNFYVRGISLSAPSWSLLDTGQHLTIRGNAEFDRFIPRVYDYLNFFPFYAGYARQRQVDMPAVGVLDEFGVPLLLDQFSPETRYESMQLLQRSVRWRTLKNSATNRIARPAKELISEWETGFDMSPGIEEQQEKELIAALGDPKIAYLDFYLGDYDHTAHLTNDEASQRALIQRLDARLGRLWNAIQASPMMADTVLVLVSDHGMNSTAGIYSQGFNLVKLFNSGEGGGHHVVTVRHPMTEYKLRGLDPFVSYVVTQSPESPYLRNQNDYPTALIDPDGNERASVQLRNSDLNQLQILLLQLRRDDLDMARRIAIRAAVLQIINANRAVWSKTVKELDQELTALSKAIERQRLLIAADPKKFNKADADLELDDVAHRHRVTLDTWQTDERGYKEYTRTIDRLLNLKETDLEADRLHVDALIPKGVMGESNSLGQLQNYVVGMSQSNVALTAQGALDLDRTFQRVNYFKMLSSVRVRNLVQKDLGIAPIDFAAIRVHGDALSLPAQDRPDVYGVFACVDDEHEALILPRIRNGVLWLRYIPVHGLVQDSAGATQFSAAPWAGGFPLRLWEDPNLNVEGDRASWLNGWHTEREWFEAVHRTRYSNGVIGLVEHFGRWHSDAVPPVFRVADESDWPVLRRFAERRRELTEADLLIFASDHWNFNVRGFNPGGNHGSFLRISTHSVLMAAGGGVPAGLLIDRPYDSLSFVPTLLSMLGHLPAERRSSYQGPLIEELVH